MSNELSNAERKTHLNMVADDRNTWIVFSDDPVMMRRLDAIAEVLPGGSSGKHYRLRADQVSFRKGKKQLSEARRAQLADRMRSLRRSTVTA
jgi:hypothetical protein